MATLLLTPLLFAGIFHTYVDFQDFKVKIFGESIKVGVVSQFQALPDSTIRICPCYVHLDPLKQAGYSPTSIIKQQGGTALEFMKREKRRFGDDVAYDFWTFHVDTLGEHDSFMLHFEKSDTSRGVVLRDSVVLKLKRKSVTCLKPFCTILRG